MGAREIILSHLSPMIILAKFNINLKYMSKRPRMHTYTHRYVCVSIHIYQHIYKC